MWIAEAVLCAMRVMILPSNAVTRVQGGSPAFQLLTQQTCPDPPNQPFLEAKSHIFHTQGNRQLKCSGAHASLGGLISPVFWLHGTNQNKMSYWNAGQALSTLILWSVSSNVSLVHPSCIGTSSTEGAYGGEVRLELVRKVSNQQWNVKFHSSFMTKTRDIWCCCWSSSLTGFKIVGKRLCHCQWCIFKGPKIIVLRYYSPNSSPTTIKATVSRPFISCSQSHSLLRVSCPHPHPLPLILQQQVYKLYLTATCHHLNMHPCWSGEKTAAEATTRRQCCRQKGNVFPLHLQKRVSDLLAGFPLWAIILFSALHL